MVSLARSIEISSGAFSSENSTAEDRENLLPVLQSYGIFRPLKTIHISTIHLLYTFALNIVAIVYAVLHRDEKLRCREYFVIIYLHIGLWFLTLLIDRLIKVKHHDLRLNGYLEFYQDTKLHISLPIYVVSFWTAALMICQTVMQQVYPDDFAEKCLKGGGFSPVSYLAALITVEFFAIAGINTNYMLKVYKFNKAKPAPDIQREEWSNLSPEVLNEHNEVGCRQLGDRVYDFLEKQADLIKHLKEHNTRLAERLMLTSVQLQQARRGRNEN